jgi:hypothetical protein
MRGPAVGAFVRLPNRQGEREQLPPVVMESQSEFASASVDRLKAPDREVRVGFSVILRF